MDAVPCHDRADRRRESRFAANVEAMLHWNGVRHTVVIRNISIYGALLTGTWTPPMGERVMLFVDGLEIFGTVIWKGPDRCGLLLCRPVDPVAVIAESGLDTVENPPITLHRVAADTYV